MANESNSQNNFKELSLNELCDKLSYKADTLILFHIRPDGDAVGSAFSLANILRELGNKVFCVCGDEIPDRLKFIVDNEQESVLVSALNGSFKPKRIITVDCAAKNQLGELGSIYKDQIDIMIDHHKTGMPFADNYINPDACATGEIIFDIAKELSARGLLKSLTKRICETAYTAISSDTGCFKYSNTTEKTHLIAAELIKAQIDSAKINFLLFDAKTMEQLGVERYAIEHLKLYDNGEISIVSMTLDDVQKNNFLPDNLDMLIDIARSVYGVRAAASLRQLPAKNQFKVSMRANEEIDVSTVCKFFGGGGHIRAAGCTITADSEEQALSMLLSRLRLQMKINNGEHS